MLPAVTQPSCAVLSSPHCAHTVQCPCFYPCSRCPCGMHVLISMLTLPMRHACAYIHAHSATYCQSHSHPALSPQTLADSALSFPSYQQPGDPAIGRSPQYAPMPPMYPPLPLQAVWKHHEFDLLSKRCSLPPPPLQAVWKHHEFDPPP